MTVSFEYADPTSTGQGHEDFVLQIPPHLESKVDLCAAYARVGRFPSDFGANWDALLDCLRDLSWIPNRGVVVVHSDLPLHLDRRECRSYLEILQTALVDWARPSPSERLTASWPYVDHKLRAVFPTEARPAIERLMQADA